MSSKNNAEQVVRLKQRVTELETQVTDYKKRLDSLRKAKNTMIVKREREVLEVGAPNLGQRGEPKERDDNKVPAGDLEALIKKHAAELEDRKKKQAPPCNHEEEIRRLKMTIEELESDKAVLVIENDEIKEQYETTLRDMSIREAEWCEKEEQFNLMMKQTKFGDKYVEWMSKTEAKIQELENTNALLRQYLKKSGRPDPTPGAASEGES